jgi:hypothetical protein
LERARRAAEAAHIAAGGDEASRLELLLGDIRVISKDKLAMPSADLVKELVAIEGRPWADGLGKNRDKALSQNRLASMLRPLKITSETIRVGDKTPKGYVFKYFDEAFARYLPSQEASEPPHRHNVDETGTSDLFQSATSESDVADRKCEKPANDGACGGAAVAEGGAGEKARARSVKSRSDDLPYHGPVVAVPDLGPDQLDEHGAPPPANGGDGVGISTRHIQRLADEYQDRAYANSQETGGDTRTAECDAWLRQKLADEGVRPEHIEIEFRRVMAAVFRV